MKIFRLAAVFVLFFPINSGYTDVLSIRKTPIYYRTLFSTAISKFYIDCDRYPRDFFELASPRAVCQKWDGPYLFKEKFQDEWGGSYIYILDNIGAPLILSCGEDRKFGTSDDLIFRLGEQHKKD